MRGGGGSARMIHVQTFLPVKHWRQSFTTFSNIVSMQENVFFFSHPE